MSNVTFIFILCMFAAVIGGMTYGLILTGEYYLIFIPWLLIGGVSIIIVRAWKDESSAPDPRRYYGE